jgi:6-phosphogluconolactonase
MERPIVIIHEDSDALAGKAADLITECAQEAIRRRGRATLVLSGGSTPEKTYALLAQPDRMVAIDCSKTFVFFGDERMVPPEDPRSSFAMARKAFLDRVGLSDSHVFPISTEGRDAAQAAKTYAECLARFFSASPASGPPRFDLVLLGLGEDGHTASLFPGAAALDVQDAWVTWSPPGTLPPSVDRVTLTYPVLNAARHVMFLVSGESKAAALRDVLEGHADRRERPAAGVQPADGTVTWLVDRDAAKLVSESYSVTNIVVRRI